MRTHLLAFALLFSCVCMPWGRVAGADVWMAVGNQGRAPATLSPVTAIAAGVGHTVAVKTDGTVVAWGDDTFGQSTVPVGLEGVTAVAAGPHHTLALRSDGTVVAWGDDAAGESTVPAGLSGVVAISAGAGHSLALKSDGTVVAWGDDSSGQSTVPAGLSGVVAIAASSSLSLAVQDDGTLVAWGLQLNGTPLDVAALHLGTVVGVSAGDDRITALLADGTPANVIAHDDADLGAVLSTETVGVTSIAAGDTFSLALKSDGTVDGWGSLDQGQLSMRGRLSGVVAIAAGGSHAVALKADGTLVGWGDNAAGQGVPADMGGVVSLEARAGDVLALRADHSVLEWGAHVASAPAGLDSVLAVALGLNHQLALKGDGTVVEWGFFPSTLDRVPLPSGLSGVTAIAAGWTHSVALRSNGKVVTWDDERAGGGTTLTGVVRIAAGNNFSVALKSDGTVAAWGVAAHGRTTVPSGLSGVVKIAAGDDHVLALKSDGTVVAWGDDSAGQATVPPGLSGVVAIRAGGRHSLALKSDGSVVAWGDDSSGQSTIPAGVGAVSDLTAGDGTTWLRCAARSANAVLVTDRVVVADGTAKRTSITTANGYEPTAVTYNGSFTPPSAPGVYTVVATADYLDSYGSGSGTLTIAGPGDAPIGLGHLSAMYDGSAHAVTVITAPAGLAVSVTYNGSASAPVVPGSYAVVATLTEPGHSGSVSATLVITPAPLLAVADGATRIQGAPNPVFTGTLTGMVAGDGITATWTSSASTATTVGTYGPATAEAITPVLSGPLGRLARYSVTTTKGTLAVTPSADDGSGDSSSCGVGSNSGLILGLALLVGFSFRRRRGASGR